MTFLTGIRILPKLLVITEMFTYVDHSINKGT